MPKINLRPEDDRKLERIAPPVLKGKRRSTQRIRWAIDELAAQIKGTAHLNRRKMV